jgi:hypothetical protein
MLDAWQNEVAIVVYILAGANVNFKNPHYDLDQPRHYNCKRQGVPWLGWAILHGILTARVY